MRYFLVDFENIQYGSLVGLEYLGKKDKIILFHSGENDYLPIPIISDIQKYNVSIEYVKITNGIPNALDFKLVCYLGYLAGKFRGSNIIFEIISNDKGYDSIKEVIQLFQLNFVTINRVSCIAETFVEIPKKPPIVKPTTKKCNIEQLVLVKKTNEILKTLNDKKIREIILLAYKKTKSKSEVHNYIMKQLGNEETKKIYSLLRPTLKEYEHQLKLIQ